MGIAAFAFSVAYLANYLLSKLFIYSQFLGVMIGSLVGIACLYYWYLQGRPTIPVSPEDSFVEKSVHVEELIFQLNFVTACIAVYGGPNAAIDEQERERISTAVKNTFERIRTSSLTKDLNILEDETLLSSEVGRNLLLSRSVQLKNWLSDRLVALKNAEAEGLRNIEQARDRNRQLIDRTHGRLSSEIRQLTARANAYLVIGSFATIVAASYLYMSAPDAIREFNAANSLKNGVLVYSSFIPLITRIAIALAIEIFAFYFLKLHREVMGNVKYYQNEITNVDLKAIGLNAAYSVNENNGLKGVVEELSKAERNFILNEKQTTVELEKLRYEKNSLTEVLDKVTGLLKSK